MMSRKKRKLHAWQHGFMGDTKHDNLIDSINEDKYFKIWYAGMSMAIDTGHRFRITNWGI